MQSLKANPPSARFARDIENELAATNEFSDTEYGPHEPDGQFAHVRAQYPGVILEISFPEKRKDLVRLADDYLLRSNGAIRVMIGVDLKYQGSEKAIGFGLAPPISAAMILA